MSEKAIKKTAWRLITSFQACENYEREQAYDYLYCMLPTLEETYKDDPEELKKRLKAHNEFFNCNPVFTGPILGITSAMEENKVDEKTIQSLKVGLMGPLAGIGDTLVFTIYISILFSLGASFAQQGSIVGPLMVIPLTFIPLFLCRYFGTTIAYKKGMESIEKITAALDKVTTIAQEFGLVIIGAMSVLLVTAKTSISFSVGDTTIALQDKLDALLPGLLSVLFVFVSYKLLTRAKWSPVKVLFFLLGVGFVLGAIGVL
jgi:mannose/fructose/N-acetylgalactosamine-specific phosphotransferase system component IID